MSLLSNNPIFLGFDNFQKADSQQPEDSAKNLNERIERSASKSKVSKEGSKRKLDGRVTEKCPSDEGHLLLQKKIEDFTNARAEVVESIKQEHEEKRGYYKQKEVLAQAEKRFENRECEFSLIVETSNRGRKSVKIYKLFGDGGQKKAWHFSSRKALLLANYDTAPCTTEERTLLFAQSWQNSVREEVRVSAFLKKHHMMSGHSQEVKVFLDKNSDIFVPAYICDSFEFLEGKGIFIIEGKSDKSGTWLKKDNRKIFQNPVERLEERCWDTVFKPLLGDIAKVVTYRIPARGDSFNIAVVKNANSSESQYHVRYFGLDFSIKGESHTLPLKKVTLSQAETKEEVSSLLSAYVGRILEIEFNGIEEHYVDLKDALVEKYTTSILNGLAGLLDA